MMFFQKNSHVKSFIFWDIPQCSPIFQGTTRRYIPEDRTFQNHRCENLKSDNRHISFILIKLH
jgi:hypothetical protein